MFPVTVHVAWFMTVQKVALSERQQMDGQFVNHGTQKGQTVMVLPLGSHSKCTYNPDTWYPLSAGGTCRGNLTKWQTKCPYADLSEDSVLQNAILKKSTNSTPKLQFYTLKRSAERFFLNIPYIGCCLATFWCTSFGITIFYFYPVFKICHKQLTRETTNPTLPPRHHHNMESAGHDYILVSQYYSLLLIITNYVH